MNHDNVHSLDHDEPMISAQEDHAVEGAPPSGVVPHSSKGTEMERRGEEKVCKGSQVTQC